MEIHTVIQVFAYSLSAAEVLWLSECFSLVDVVLFNKFNNKNMQHLGYVFSTPEIY